MSTQSVSFDPSPTVYPDAAPRVGPGRVALWAGRVLGGLVGVMLVMSAVMKMSGSPEVAAGFAHLGLPAESVTKIAVLELVCALVYLVPYTAVLGAVLLTGYMGGAIAMHVRLGEPFVTQLMIGVLAWGALYLRDVRLRGLLPLRGV